LKTTRRRLPVIAAAAVLLVFAAAACTAAGPTPIYIYLTPTPAQITPTPEPTPSPTPTPTPVPTPTPASSASSSASAAATPTPTPTPAVTPGPSGPAGACSGSAGNKDFFVQAANVLTFNVYCAKLPSGWYLGSATYELPSGGLLRASYKGPNSATFSISEGAYCTAGTAACSPKDSSLGNAKFGDLSGALVSVAGGYAVYVAPGTARAYSASGKGMTQATFVALAAAISRVPKS